MTSPKHRNGPGWDPIDLLLLQRIVTSRNYCRARCTTTGSPTGSRITPWMKSPRQPRHKTVVVVAMGLVRSRCVSASGKMAVRRPQSRLVRWAAQQAVQTARVRAAGQSLQSSQWHEFPVRLQECWTPRGESQLLCGAAAVFAYRNNNSTVPKPRRWWSWLRQSFWWCLHRWRLQT